MLNQIIQEEFGFDIIEYDIKVINENVTMPTDGAFFAVNLFFKLINGTPLSSLAFAEKEKPVLLDRLLWLLLKIKGIEEIIKIAKIAEATTKKSSKYNGRFEAESDDEDDLNLDDAAVSRRPIDRENSRFNTENTMKRTEQFKNSRYQDTEDDYDNTSNM